MCQCTCKYTRDAMLRFGQGACQVTTVLSGLATTLGMGWASTVYDYKCPLDANLTLTYTAHLKTVAVDDGASAWGRKSTCEYTTFAPAVAAIYASVWFWFYILLSRGSRSDDDDDDDENEEDAAKRGEGERKSQVDVNGARLKVPPLPYSDVTRRHLVVKKSQRGPPDMQLLMPTILFNVILWVCAVISLAIIDRGFRAWCNGIQLYIRDKSCSYASQVTWINYEYGHMTYHYIVWALVGNWFLVLSILGTIVIVAVRLYYLFLEINNDKRHKKPPETKPPEQWPTAIWHDSSQSYSNPVFDISEQDVDNGFIFVDVHTNDGDNKKEIKTVLWENEVTLGESLKDAGRRSEIRDSLKSAENSRGDLKDAIGSGGDLKNAKSLRDDLKNSGDKDTRDHLKTVTDEGDGLKDVKNATREDKTTTSDTCTVTYQGDTKQDKSNTRDKTDTLTADQTENSKSRTKNSEQLSLIQGNNQKSYQSMS